MKNWQRIPTTRLTLGGELMVPRDNHTLAFSTELLNYTILQNKRRRSSIDFGIYLHAIFHSVFTFTVQSPQNLRSNPYNRKSENGS